MKKLLALFSILTCATVFAADYYVDSTANATTATGSSSSPFTTIKAAVDAANAQYTADGIPSTINVKGGESCTYTIATADDLISVTASNLTIQAWAGTGTPKIVLDSELSVAKNNPHVIVFQAGADDCLIQGLDFYYNVSGKNEYPGNSLGKDGRIIETYANRLTVDDCGFYQSSVVSVSWGVGHVIASCGTQQTYGTVGADLTVQNCHFSKVGTTDLGRRPIRASLRTKMIGNTFEECRGYFYIVKPSDYGQFISNKVLNAYAPIYSNGESYNEYNNAEIAYNVFINSAAPIFNKSSQGMKNVKIHHNTIVGADSFIIVDHPNNDNVMSITWQPNIYNNLIILPKDGASIITELSQHVSSDVPTSFLKGSMFNNNVWLSSDFSGGTALEEDFYKLEASTPDEVGLYVDENVELSRAPDFLETTDVSSENFYRLNSRRYPWVLGSDFTYGTNPAYVGAVEPIDIPFTPGDFFKVESFEITSGEFFTSHELTFEVKYWDNIGEVTISADFDGDGSFDYVGTDTTIKYTYSNSGTFVPLVKAVDNATGKEVTANLQTPAIQILGKYLYVDVNAADNGDGTEQRPYNDISVALANSHNKGVVICVRGGEDRLYEINTADDLIVIDKPNLTIKSWGDYGYPKFIISHTLSGSVDNPLVLTVAEGATDVTISELEFVWYGNNNELHPGDSIGHDGKVIATYEERTLVKNCKFRLEGSSSKNPNSFAVACAIQDQKADIGKYLRVEGCVFEGDTDNARQMNAIQCGKFVEVVKNVFTNCNRSFTLCKNAYNNHIGVISNAFYECATIPSSSIWGYWNDTQNADIAYNIFVTSSGEPFISKKGSGFDNNVNIHHNTVIGASSFLVVSSSEKTLRPQIYDNLILLAQDGVVIMDNSSKLASGYTSAFNEETSFNNNVYLANTFFDGSALALDGYACNLTAVNCRKLNTSPRFMSTEMGNADEYRIRATKLDWAFTSSVGGYPNYVGAVEPFLAPLSTTIIIK